jgi:hypothetical protein
VKDKKITDLKEGDSLYVQKLIGGFNVSIECTFIKYKKGKVTAKIIRTDNQWISVNTLYPTGILTAKPCKCYLWGLGDDPRMSWKHCHWCKDGVFI